MMNSKIIKGVEALIYNCACLKKGEKVLILSEKDMYSIGKLFEDVSSDITSEIIHEVMLPRKNHGEEPSLAIADLMSKADVVFCLTRYSLAHSDARKKASERGVRFLSLPDYSEEVLSSKALQADFKVQRDLCEKLAVILTNAEEIEIITDLGTKLCLCIKGRIANAASGVCDQKGCLGSPPDIEVNIAPVEEKTEGIIVIDGSIPVPQIGILNSDIIINVSQGRIKDMRGAQADVLRNIFEKVKNNKVYVLGELGIGLNPLAQLCGRMLEDEGVLGSVHFGFGSNSTIGGKNKVPFHVDMVIKKATLSLDGRDILRKGKLCV